MPSQHITWNQMIKFKNVIYHLSNDCFLSLFSIFFVCFYASIDFLNSNKMKWNAAKQKKQQKQTRELQKKF